MNFKKIFSIILLLTVIILSCEKEDDYQSTAVITGPDLRECICCGGYYIELGDSTYNFNTLPASAQIDLTTEDFPLPVKLDWTYDTKCGDIQYIEITKIAKQ